MKNHDALIVIAKYPEKGKVKTRIKGLTDDQRVELFTQLLNQTMDNLGNIAGIDTFVAFAPENAADYFAKFNVRLIALHNGDLGTRMFEAFKEVFKRGYQKAALVGADIPDLKESTIKRAFDVLSNDDLVFGPAEDGGYYLVGMRMLIKEVFENVTWSTDQTLIKSIEQAEKRKFSIGYTEMLSDIDTFQDLQRAGYYSKGNDVSI